MICDNVPGGVKLGFIGVGNMGGALVRAARRTMPGEAIRIANRSPEKAQALAAELSCQVQDKIGRAHV